ncbi:tRNA (adenosine(37)-N6)-threonylcarbamoyltransferase complex dimerization subunit type 1 TsaB [Microbacterium sp.]|uniref:tRNA (adenosine(37)-N6)-threonylcarbamoyltransferase complex dimerization subunit type 1 TsaB n=1 Tax=Microbacterium sp. TaxID=51671 RepID=UPI003A9141BC
MILSVDTSLGTAVALIDADGRARATAESPDPLGHAEVIGTLLHQALADAGVGEITHVVAGMGPGPFTGLRIGIAAARAFALGRGIPVIPVPSHFAAALVVIDPSTGSGIDSTGPVAEPVEASTRPVAEPVEASAGRFAIVTDARRREVAISIFDGVDADGIPNLVEPTVLVPRADSEERLRGIHAIEVATLDAAALARVGLRAARAGRVLADAEPLYLRQPDVTVPGAPKRVN